MNKLVSVFFVLGWLVISHPVHARTLDLQDPSYQKQVEEYMKARELAVQLKASLLRGQALYKQPFSPNRAVPTLNELIDSLDLILAPENKRREAHIIKPGSLFFKPAKSKE